MVAVAGLMVACGSGDTLLPALTDDSTCEDAVAIVTTAIDEARALYTRSAKLRRSTDIVAPLHERATMALEHTEGVLMALELLPAEYRCVARGCETQSLTL